MNQAAFRTGLLILPLFLLLGCDGGERVTTNTLFANSNCKGALEPIALVSLAEVASYRGTNLLQGSEPTGQATQHASINTRVTTKTDGEATDQDSDRPLFVALSKGIQPSRGFELHLADQAVVTQDQGIEGRSLEIPVYWTTPDPQKPHPLINTNPCLVVSVPNAGWQRIEAVDQDGNSLGSLKVK